MRSGRWTIPDQPTESGCTRTTAAGPAVTGRAPVPGVLQADSPAASTAAAKMPTILDVLAN